MASLAYTNPDDIRGAGISGNPRNPYVMGYGRKIPTRYVVKTGNRWHRVYAMCYGNSSSVYILIRGVETFLDIDTEYRLSGMTGGDLMD